MGGVPKNGVVVGDCLRRLAETHALKDLLMGLSPDIPAALIVQQYLSESTTGFTSFKLENWLGNSVSVNRDALVRAICMPSRNF